MNTGRNWRRIAIYVYIVGVVYLLILTILSLLSPRNVEHSLESFDGFNECVQSSNYPDCISEIRKIDFTYPWVYRALADVNHDRIAPIARESGRFLQAAQAELLYVWNLQLYFILLFTVIPYLIGWVVLGGYLLFYRSISRQHYKWIEALVTGVGISALAWVLDRQGFQVAQANDASTTLPFELLILSICYLVLWFTPDLLHRRTDNFLVKAIMIAVAMITMSILPLNRASLLVAVVLVTLMLAGGFGYWSLLTDTRRQVAVIVYFTLIAGTIAGIAKHWSFLTSSAFGIGYEQEQLAEFVNDSILFFLGTLLAYLEISRESQDDRHSMEANISDTRESSVPVTVEIQPLQEESSERTAMSTEKNEKLSRNIGLGIIAIVIVAIISQLRSNERDKPEN